MIHTNGKQKDNSKGIPAEHRAHLFELENKEEGMKCVITKGRKGYHVTTFDTEATKALPLVHIFPGFDEEAYQKAINKCKAILGIIE